MHAGLRSMSGVIVVDAESFRSTCHGRDAYIHDHCLDILITMLNSANCSTVICSPTVEYLCSWEKPLVKPMALGSILIVSISIAYLLALFLHCLLLFTLHLYTKNTKNIFILSYYLYQISLSQVAMKGLTTPSWPLAKVRSDRDSMIR